MPISVGFIRKQINRVAVDRAAQINDHNIWLRCPFHAKGQESTGSMVLNLDSEKGFRPGSWHCFGCGADGQWNDLADKLKLKRYKATESDNFFLEITDTERAELLDDRTNNQLPPEIRMAERWSSTTKWRNINGKLIRQLGGRSLTNEFGTRLYLPVKINKRIAGSVLCSLTKYAKRKYIMDTGIARESLYPYDYVRRQLNRQPRNAKRIIVLVEGVRDALNLIQHGLLALAILGGATVWHQAKANLLMTLEPNIVVLGFDPDEIGRKVTQLARDTLRSEVRLLQLNFPRRRRSKTKQDAGNMKRSRILRIRRQLAKL